LRVLHCRQVYGKAVDKLQTNHRGVFVLKDFGFKWTAQHSGKSDVASKQLQLKYLKFPSGLLRGALKALGFDASVSAEVDSSDASRQVTSFHVRLST
jgi:hypothetical protein